MEAWTSLQFSFLSKIYEQATRRKWMHYRDAVAMNCFATNHGVFFELLYVNSVELVGSTFY